MLQSWAPGQGHSLSQLPAPSRGFSSAQGSALLHTGWKHSPSTALLKCCPWRHWGQLGRVQTRNPRGSTAPDPDPHDLAVLAPTINPSAPELLLLSSFALEKNPKKASFLGEVFVPRAESDHRSQWERPDGHPGVWESSACSCPIEPWRSQAPHPCPSAHPCCWICPSG